MKDPLLYAVDLGLIFEMQQGPKIACLEKIARKQDPIDSDYLRACFAESSKICCGADLR
jgi:hypothetical protein